MRTRAVRRLAVLVAAMLPLVAAVAPATAARAPARFTTHQRAVLRGIAHDTWQFFRRDVDPQTHLPLDNLGPGTTRGAYTSAANVGVYLWAVVAARDLGVISTARADRRVLATLREVRRIKRSHGFMYQWYDTSTGQPISNPGEAACTSDSGTQDNCSFLSAVDNGWLASGLIVVRHALPATKRLASRLLGRMNFGIFYDNRAETNCNVNHQIDDQPTGQMYGGYYVGTGPAGYHNGAIYSDPRIAMYIGMGLHQMPGAVWWRTWRTLPPKRCSTDPDFSWQGQWPPQGHWAKVTDPQSGKVFPVWEGHYTYGGSALRFLPTYNGGMFEGLMANQVVPETRWGTRGFGLADRRTVTVQRRYALDKLGYPVWGISPSSTPDNSGGYQAYGVQGLRFRAGHQLAIGPCASPCSYDPESTVTPHASFIALPIAPHRAYRNIMTLRRTYPSIYTAKGGFYDAVDPTTGSVGHRMLVLDQSMVMAGLDNALHRQRLQRWFAQDPVASVDKEYLRVEHMSL